MLSLIAAMGEGRIIGNHGRLPWHLPADLRRFRLRTLSHLVIMGRITYESIVQSLGHPLEGRQNLVLSADPSFAPEGVSVARSFSEVLTHAQKEPEAFVIGGQSLYELALPHAERIYLTEVLGNFPGDRTFPPLPHDRFVAVERSFYPKDVDNPYDQTLVVYSCTRRS